ncbi:MAG: cytochrome C [Bryobacterales bacterium]|nr:cytochrome C [Bryobacterales bacterium]
MDWAQVWEIVSLPDNIPIVAIAVLVPFYTWYAARQARATDRLIAQLEADPQMAKTHHRKIHPFRPGWARELPVWPYLLRIEFLAALVVTLILMVWSITLNAPLEEPANPNHTMNPSKAPWYFVGLQEMLVYFDPWFAGVVLPTLIIVGLMVFPYVDTNPLGTGYYTIRQRRVALAGFGIGFFIWLALVFIGTFVRGPGWMWFWPGQTWDHTRVVYEVNRNLPDLFGITNAWLQAILGIIAIAVFYAGSAWGIHKLVTRSELDRKIYERTSLTQYVVFQFFAITILVGLPAKMLLRLLFRIKYVLVTPWLNV